MGILDADKLSATLFGKTRRAVLLLLCGRPDEAFHLRHIPRVVDAGNGAVQRELKLLTEAGIALRTTRAKQVYYQANMDLDVFPELTGLVFKTAGLADTLRNSLAPLADRIEVALVYGAGREERQRRHRPSGHR